MNKSNKVTRKKAAPSNRFKKIDALKKRLDAATRRVSILIRVNRFLSRYKDQPHLYLYFSERLDQLLKSRKFQDIFLKSKRFN